MRDPAYLTVPWLDVPIYYYHTSLTVTGNLCIS